MSEFNKQYVCTEFTDEMEGKEAFLADSIFDLKNCIEQGTATCYAIERGSDRNPFRYKASPTDKSGTAGHYYIFAYFDPNLEAKKAHEKGHALEYRDKGETEWHCWPSTLTPDWVEHFYRPAPDLPKDGNRIMLYMDARKKLFLTRELLDARNVLASGPKDFCLERAFEGWCQHCTHFAECAEVGCGTKIMNNTCLGYEQSHEDVTYRPFRDMNELRFTWKCFFPAGSILRPVTVRPKGSDAQYLITGYNQEYGVWILNGWVSLKDLYRNYAFALGDKKGLPCGKKVYAVDDDDLDTCDVE